MRVFKSLLALPVFGSLAACAVPGPPAKDYTAFTTANPHSILIVPVVNDTAEVSAASTFLATLAPPLANRGYYVFPVNLVRHTMQDSGLGDADLVAKADSARVARLFGADAVLYARIEQWNAKYLVVTSSVTVQVHYTLKSGKDGSTLWDQDITTVYQPHAASGGNPLAALIVDAVVAAVTRAHPDYIPLADQANVLAFDTPNQGVPYGPYAPKPGGF